MQYIPTTVDPSLKGTFDAVFTSATLHWAKADPAGVVDGIKWLLKPGGRVAFEFGGFGNASVWTYLCFHCQAFTDKQCWRTRGSIPSPQEPETRSNPP